MSDTIKLKQAQNITDSAIRNSKAAEAILWKAIEDAKRKGDVKRAKRLERMHTENENGRSSLGRSSMFIEMELNEDY